MCRLPACGKASSPKLTDSTPCTTRTALGMIHVRMAPAIIAVQPCHLVYFPYTNSINLINVAQNAMVGPDVKVGSANQLSNGYCSVDATKVTASLSGSANLRVPVSFVDPGFRRV